MGLFFNYLCKFDYYPGGMLMPGRYSPPNYRFGYNGKEKIDEVKGVGNWQDYGMRNYDPRLCRFPSVDPLGAEFPWYSPYQYAGNKPIWKVDLDGLEEATPPSQNKDGTEVAPRNSTATPPINPDFVLDLTEKTDGERMFPRSSNNVDLHAEVSAGIGPIKLVKAGGNTADLAKPKTPANSVTTNTGGVFANFGFETEDVTVMKFKGVQTTHVDGQKCRIPLVSEFKEHTEILSLGLFKITTREVFHNQKRVVYQAHFTLSISTGLKTPKADKTDANPVVIKGKIGMDLNTNPINLNPE